MSRLRTPIRQVLDDRLPEPDVQRIWRALQQRSPRRRPRAWSQPLMAAAALLLLGLAGWLSLRGSRAPEPLAIVGADVLSPSRVLDGDVATVWPLSDGSRIRLAGASRLQVLENNDRAFRLRLDGGRGEFDVKPGGPRRWRIDSGDLSVEVVGTSFVVRRDAQAVSVDVRHGIVRVRSARLAGGARRLVAGEHLSLPAQQLSAVPPQPQLASTPAQAANDDQQPAAANPPAPRAPNTSRPATSVQVSRAPEGVQPSALLRSADQARRNGSVPHAEALLERVRVGWPGTPHAALASLTLARMRIARAPELAARDLQAALAAELPQSLREDAMARLVEAHSRASQLELARSAAEAYRHAFPDGRRRAEIERWAQLP